MQKSMLQIKNSSSDISLDRDADSSVRWKNSETNAEERKKKLSEK